MWLQAETVESGRQGEALWSGQKQTGRSKHGTAPTTQREGYTPETGGRESGKSKSKTHKYVSEWSSNPDGRNGSGETQQLQEKGRPSHGRSWCRRAPPTLLRDAEAETKPQVSLLLSVASRTGERLWIN